MKPEKEKSQNHISEKEILNWLKTLNENNTLPNLQFENTQEAYELYKNYKASKLNLTFKEKEVLKLIVKKQTTRDIAEKLVLAIKTVDNIKRNLRLKTNTKNTKELIMYAFANNIL